MNKVEKDIGFSTKCIHAGNLKHENFEVMRTPLYLSSNYKLPKDGKTLIPWDQPVPGTYSRCGNENEMVLERKLAAIEGAEDCAVFASGAAALSAVFFSVLHAGDHVLVSTVCYTAVRRIFTEVFPLQYNVTISFVDTTNTEEIRKAIQPNTRLIHIETPGNPSTLISDIAAISEIAKEHGILLSVDSTFASPFCQKPLEFGADYSITSLTKYCNGHGDVLGGCVMGAKEKIIKLKDHAVLVFGGILNPFAAWLIERGLKTLPLRMQQHCTNAMAIAEFLEKQDEVEFVLYPGLPSHPNYSLAKRQMHNGFSGMMIFNIYGGEKRCWKFMESLKLVEYAVSLGEIETIITYVKPDAPEMSFYPKFMQGGFFRLSVGLENVEDILSDFTIAFEKIRMK